MGLLEEQIAAAKAVQDTIAQDAATAIRVVAGPGTGKSRAVEERTRWLIQDQQTPAGGIKVVSFTRASSTDLRARVHRTLTLEDVANPQAVQVATLHSLALGALRRANLLAEYPVDPSVLDAWEQTNLVDEEFALTASGLTPGRAKAIRQFHEALWATEERYPPNYRAPQEAITEAEEQAFVAFHSRRTQTYSYVLPGEMVLKCVEQARMGLLNLREQIGADHLLVDEFQDLNPMDLEFVRIVHGEGVVLWVCGDDDQSIYSFRHATPRGIQTFDRIYAEASLHELTDCFRCAPNILDAATKLLSKHAGPGRIPKSTRSLWATADPPVLGTVECWTFGRADEEAKGVAAACQNLIAAGEDPSEILILIGNKRALTKTIQKALDTAEVPYDSFRSESFKDSDLGRFVLSALRIVCEPNDYVAYRALLQTLRGVGVGTCAQIADQIVEGNLRFREVFYSTAARDGFSGRERNALDQAGAVCGEISEWACGEEVSKRREALHGLAEQNRSAAEAEAWDAFVAALPGAITLRELRDYIWADTEAQQDEVLRRAKERIGESKPLLVPGPSGRVRLMTLHGSKGLTARYVFIPGLEEKLLPNQFQREHPGGIEEAARLLYVGMTRARIGLVLSWAKSRMLQGQWTSMNPSRFARSTGGKFVCHRGGFDQGVVAALLAEAQSLP